MLKEKGQENGTRVERKRKTIERLEKGGIIKEEKNDIYLQCEMKG